MQLALESHALAPCPVAASACSLLASAIGHRGSAPGAVQSGSRLAPRQPPTARCHPKACLGAATAPRPACSQASRRGVEGQMAASPCRSLHPAAPLQPACRAAAPPPQPEPPASRRHRECRSAPRAFWAEPGGGIEVCANDQCGDRTAAQVDSADSGHRLPGAAVVLHHTHQPAGSRAGGRASGRLSLCARGCAQPPLRTQGALPSACGVLTCNARHQCYLPAREHSAFPPRSTAAPVALQIQVGISKAQARAGGGERAGRARRAAAARQLLSVQPLVAAGWMGGRVAGSRQLHQARWN